MGMRGQGEHRSGDQPALPGEALLGEDGAGGRGQDQEDAGRGGDHRPSITEVAPGGDGSKAAAEVSEGGEVRYRREGANILFP